MRIVIWEPRWRGGVNKSAFAAKKVLGVRPSKFTRRQLSMIFSTYFWPEVIWALQLGFWASESPGSHIFLSKFIMVKWGKSWNHRLSGAQNPSWSAQITSGQKYDKTNTLGCLRVNFEGLTPNTFFSVLAYLLTPPSVRFSNNYPQLS